MVIAAIFAAGCTLGSAAAPRATAAPSAPLMVRASTKIAVSVTKPLISNVAKTSEPFTFVTQAEVLAGGTVVVRKGTVGSGTIAGGGATNRTIALRLQFTEKTVQKHISHIFRKLNVSSRAQLAVFIVVGDRPTL